MNKRPNPSPSNRHAAPRFHRREVAAPPATARRREIVRSETLSDLFAIGALALALAVGAAHAEGVPGDDEEVELSVEATTSSTSAPPLDPQIAELLGDPVTEELADPGSLLLQTEHDGLYLPAPQLDTEVHLRVAGIVVRAEVVQRFHNPTDRWVEGLYLFPLPDRAVVDTLEMRVGDRIVIGEIQEREQAQRTYTQARQSGRRASLVRQERPNVFRTAVANIGPGETVEIALEFQQLAAFDGANFRLRFPTVVAPRYHGETSPHLIAAGVPDEPIPSLVHTEGDGGAPSIQLASLGPGGAPHPAVALTSSRRASPSFLLTVDLEPGFPLEAISSSYHPIETIEIAAGRYGIGLIDPTARMDRDFELVWAPSLNRVPQTILLSEEFGGELYALLMMLPPDPVTGADLALPREAVFVIDTSGSMSGESIVQARAALRFALSQLRPEDSFNIIRFDSETASLFPQSVPVSGWTLAEAERFIAGLEADGGTDMLPALREALDSDLGLYPVRQVVFLTDGSISNDASLFTEIEHRLGDSRLFTVAIGSAPNTHFMRKAAELGRGTFTSIGSTHEVELKMNELSAKLAHPVLSELEVIWPDATAEAWPSRVPDLYLGEPLVVAARMRDLDALTPGATLEVRGRRGSALWSDTLALPAASTESGIEKLWARRRIEHLMDRYSTGQEPDAMRRAVLETALDHHLVSRFTSLVAVDHTPATATPAGPTQPIPLALPAGWEPPFAVGNLPQTATPAPLLLLLGTIALAAGALLLLPPLRKGRA